MDAEKFLKALSKRENNARVSSVSFEKGTAVILIDLFEYADFEQTDSKHQFSVECRDTVEILADLSDFEDADYTDDHPALWKHNLPQSDLFFSSVPSHPNVLAMQLSQEHYSIYGSYRSFSEEFNMSSPESLVDLLSGGHGLLASGPAPAITRYVDTIGPSMRVNVLKTYTPTGGFKILCFHEDCYVICKSAEITGSENDIAHVVNP